MRLHVERRARDQGGQAVEQVGDRHEVLLGVVGELLVLEAIEGERLARQDADRVAVVGGASAQALPAMLVLPPGRFSTISGWPQRLRNSSPSARMKMSLVPPGLNATIALIGRAG